MTVSTEVSHNEYTGNGVTTTFPYTFRILNKADLVVQTLDTNGNITTLKVDTNYTVIGAGSYSGGSVVLPSALPSGWLITIDRELDIVQETDLRNQGKFFAEVHENAFDYLTMLIQQCFGWTRRALLKPNFLSKYYDAKQNLISNLADPVSGQDATNLRKTISLDNDVRRYAEQLAAAVSPGSGTGAFQQFGAGAIIRTFQDKMRESFSVKDFGAVGNDVNDDTQAFLYAIDYARLTRLTILVPVGKYRTSAELELPDDVSIICEPGVVFQNIDTSNKTFPCFTVSGGAKRAVFGTISGYKEGIVVKRNTKNILFNVISDCVSGVVLRAERVGGTDLSTLDNIITGTQIGRCENGIVFEQNARLTQQGNEIYVNFCSGTKHCVVWDDLGTHTQSSNWDSNIVEFQAIDPFHIPGASVCYNKTAYSVLVNTVNVIKWTGGWSDASEMSLLRGGNFDACEFNFSLAQSLTPDMVCEPSQRASFGTCQARSTRHGNTAAATPPSCVDQANLATFNGGVPLHQGVFKVRVAAPELAPGAQYIVYFNHAFCVSANSSKFALRQVRTGGNGVFVQLRDSAPTALGAVRVIVVNPTSTTMAAGNIDIVVTCVG